MMKAIPAPTALPATMTVSASNNASSSSHSHHQSRLSSSQTDWDINDATVPTVQTFDNFHEWADGHCRYVYSPDCEQAKRHTSGWAMRNTNNHNVHILKKSCLGVLICSLGCTLPCGTELRLRPAICDKARKKQLGKACPNPRCAGFLQILACKGHCGYPVTHFWRHTQSGIFFQAKGVHDHPQPETKKSVEVRKKIISTQTGLPKKVRIPKKAIIQTQTKSGFKVRRKRKHLGEKRGSSCPTDPLLIKNCYRCHQVNCICQEATISKLSTGGTNVPWSLSQRPGMAAALSQAAVAAAAANSWAATSSSLTNTPPPLTHHHHHHHLSASHHHHHLQSSSFQQPLSTGRVLEFPQFPESASSSFSKLPTSGSCSTYPSTTCDGFFKPSEIFHLDYYDQASQSSNSNHTTATTNASAVNHSTYYGITSGSCANSGSHTYGEYPGSDSLIADAALQSISAGPPWSIQSMPYANSFMSGATTSTGSTNTTSSISTAIPCTTPSAGLWSSKVGSSGTYFGPIPTDYPTELYTSECYNYYTDNNNYCWTPQQSSSNHNHGTSHLYP
ncbi:unnamed protein product [Orchesella dallaii]|uniref:GCM domain-containing protein n=1 Tax=Orchesella dallaii TaxID=48710 RepID=A0ABP1RNI3_9HEXA